MSHEIVSSTDRFEKALHLTIQNLGPRIVANMQLGLTPPQVFTLHFIEQSSQCTVTQLAEKLDVKPSAITVMLDRLENHGYVSRSRDERDRRVVRIELSAAGSRILHQVKQMRKKILEQCLYQLPQDELEPFLITLEKLAEIAVGIHAKDFFETLEINQKQNQGT